MQGFRKGILKFSEGKFDLVMISLSAHFTPNSFLIKGRWGN
ncbi:hypothetical protein SAMN05661096_00779 [Marivirga sericea]|uniref:Uncharacterized protein n=1 Tax=Marivirga sericea TaxID=1028 RepID=A0A1X7IKN1_9BACT|nr:hypothetical protein SAMN05661096_00779 [Marivirga sericea]